MGAQIKERHDPPDGRTLEGDGMRMLPDGVFGAVIAAESVQGFNALLNGPGGCRTRMQTFLKICCPQGTETDGGDYDSKFFGMRPAIPCTYLNGRDMILGSADKIREAITAVKEGSGHEPVFIDTLSASLQATDDRGICRETGTLSPEEELSSMTFGQGYDAVMRTILESAADRDVRPVKGRVNVLGYSVTDKGWEYGRTWLEKVLRSCGASDVRFIGCGCGREDVAGAGTAELNIAIHPEYCGRTAEFLRETFCTETLIPSMGSPVGYPSILSFMKESAEKLGGDPSAASEEVIADMHAVNRILTQNTGLMRSFRGAMFSVRGLASDVLPLCEWMLDHIRVLPGSVFLTDVPEPGQMKNLESFLERNSCSEAMQQKFHDLCTIRFTDGMEASYGPAEDDEDVYIPAFMPFSETTRLVDRSLIGTNGCRWVLDTVINGIGRHVCGQPTPVHGGRMMR